VGEGVNVLSESRMRAICMSGSMAALRGHVAVKHVRRYFKYPAIKEGRRLV
jgi:hypothetical protein